MARKRIAVAARIGLAWFTVTILTGFIYAGFDFQLLIQVWKTTCLWYLNFFLLGYCVSLLARRVSFDRLPKVVFFAIHIVAAVIFAVLATVLAFLDLKINPDPDMVWYLDNMYQQYFNIALYIYSLVAATYYMIHYYQRSRQQAVQAVELERLAKDAELRALRAQINPHFLFNSLNSVNALIKRDPESARSLNAKLADVLRYVLDGSEREFVTIAQEMDFIRDYLSIEQKRLGSKLDLHLDIDEAVMEERVPSMILQPLIENAIKHGIADQPQGGTLTLSIARHNGKLGIVVADTGPGINGATEEQLTRTGVGLRNTIDRLKGTYGDGFVYKLQDDHGFKVTLNLPDRKVVK